MSKKITVSIIGASGYTGIELLKILVNHPNVKIKYLTSGSLNGQKISEVYPHLAGICDIMLTNMDYAEVAKKSDVVFLATPNFEAQKIVPQIIDLTNIIDLSGDFRIQNINLYEKYYDTNHEAQKELKKFIYGLPEISQIKNYKQKNYANIANPGCFAITAQLALFPLKNLIKKVDIIAITGSSGSGKTSSEKTHHPTRIHNLKSYKINTHQHIPEIIQTINLNENKINFVPTSGPFVRGIHLTAFVELKKNVDAKKLFSKTYAKAYFVRLKETVALAEVVGSNFCDISIQQNGKNLIIQAAIDNLIKGAAGTAVQNFNLMNGLDEKTGLTHLIPLYP